MSLLDVFFKPKQIPEATQLERLQIEHYKEIFAMHEAFKEELDRLRNRIKQLEGNKK